jgi:hypothetical protein
MWFFGFSWRDDLRQHPETLHGWRAIGWPGVTCFDEATSEADLDIGGGFPGGHGTLVKEPRDHPSELKP